MPSTDHQWAALSHLGGQVPELTKNEAVALYNIVKFARLCGWPRSELDEGTREVMALVEKAEAKLYDIICSRA